MAERKYEMIKNAIKKELQSGALQPGEKLPSIRSLSARFACNKNTVIRAYQELEKEHLIYSVPKSGYYSIRRPGVPDEDEAAEFVDFSSANPDPEIMPYKDFQHCLNRAIKLYQDELFTYSDPQGFLSLRKELVKHLADYQIFTRPEQVSIVSGSQQALNLLAMMPFPNGKNVILVEQPTYHGMIRIIDALGLTAIGIRRTKKGIDLDELECHFRNNQIKFFYTMPRFHNPLGTSYDQEVKKQIAKLAAKYDVYIVEDDYLLDLETDPKNDPVFSYDLSGHTIYLKSFSKVMLPGLRMGAILLPSILTESFRLFKSACDISSATLSQAALEIYLKCGMYSRHTASMRNLYQKRMKILKEVCDLHLPPEMNAAAETGGIFGQLDLPKQLPAKEWIACLRQHHILVSSIDHCFLKTFPKVNGFRLSIIQTDKTQIEKGIRMMGEVYKKQLKSKSSAFPPKTVIHWI